MNHDDEKFHTEFRSALEKWLGNINTVLPKSLIQAYRAATYEIFDADSSHRLKIDQKSLNLTKLFERYSIDYGSFITPCNPNGELLSNEKNRALCDSYEDRLRKENITFLKGRGYDDSGEWPGEESFFLFGVSRDFAIHHGQELQQNAVVFVDASCVPELVLLK